MRFGSKLPWLDKEVIYGALFMIAPPTIGKRRSLGTLASGRPLACPAQALLARFAGSLRLIPIEHPYGVGPLAIGILVVVDAEHDMALGLPTSFFTRKHMANRKMIALVVLHVDAMPFEIGTEVRLHVGHVLRTGRPDDARERYVTGRSRVVVWRRPRFVVWGPSPNRCSRRSGADLAPVRWEFTLRRGRGGVGDLHQSAAG